MASFLHTVLAKKLLQQVDSAKLALAKAEPGSAAHTELQRALEALYSELGQELYGFSRVADEDEDVDDADTQERRLASLSGEEDEDEDVGDGPTLTSIDDEITLQRSRDFLASAGLPLDDGQTVPRIIADPGVDSTTESGATHEEHTATGSNTGGYVQSLRGDEDSRTPVRVQPLSDGSTRGWARELRALLATMEIPERWDDAVVVATEAALVQWATTDLAERWAEYPPSVRIALIGMLASRARFLEARLSVTAGPRIALERLRAFRRLHKLSPVVALIPGRGPEHTSWDADARHWWGMLVDGLAA
jgi:hypothetical protein